MRVASWLLLVALLGGCTLDSFFVRAGSRQRTGVGAGAEDLLGPGPAGPAERGRVVILGEGAEAAPARDAITSGEGARAAEEDRPEAARPVASAVGAVRQRPGRGRRPSANPPTAVSEAAAPAAGGKWARPSSDIPLAIMGVSGLLLIMLLRAPGRRAGRPG